MLGDNLRTYFGPLGTKQYCSVYYWELTSVLWGRSNIVLFTIENSLQSFGDEAVLFCLLLRTHFGPLGMKQYCSIYYWELTLVLWGTKQYCSVYYWELTSVLWGTKQYCSVDDERLWKGSSWLSLCCVGRWCVDWCVVFSLNTKSGGLVVLERLCGKRWLV